MQEQYQKEKRRFQQASCITRLNHIKTIKPFMGSEVQGSKFQGFKFSSGSESPFWPRFMREALALSSPIRNLALPW